MYLRPRYLLLLSIAASLAACANDEATIDDTLNTYTVTREDLPITVKEGGELVAVNETVVRSDVEGQAMILFLIPEGKLVKPGDKLVELDVSGLLDKRSGQEIAVGQARNALEQARTQKGILEKELETKKNTATSQLRIAQMELEKLLGATDGSGAEGKNGDMIARLEELIYPPAKPEAVSPENGNRENGKPETGPTETGPTEAAAPIKTRQVHPQNYAPLIGKVIELLRIEGEEDPLKRGMGEMANKILQQADAIRLAMAQLKVNEDTVDHSRRLAGKQIITRNELERDELAYQSQESKVTIAWNDLELLINYTLERDRIELTQNLANTELEVERVTAANDAERRNSEFDVETKAMEFDVADERLTNLVKQIKNAVIYSPGNGLVVYSKVSRGRGDSESIEEGSSVRQRQGIIVLPDNSKLQCVIKVQEAQVDKVVAGLAAYVSVEAKTNQILTGRVIKVAPVADSASRYGGNDKKVYTTTVLLDGVHVGLKAGMKAAATINVGTVENVLTAPIQSVRRDRSVNYVWQKTPSGPVAVRIEVGAHNQEKVELLSGLAEGDVVYRTPPGGQPDPKFEQPALPQVPEADPIKPVANGDSIPDRQQDGSRDGQRPGDRAWGARKKFTEMTPDELTDRKASLVTMSDRMRDRMDPVQAEKAGKLVRDITKAIDANKLEEAQRLYDSMISSMMQRGGNRGRGGEGGRNGGRPGNRDGGRRGRGGE